MMILICQVSTQWVTMATARKATLTAAYAKLQPWQKKTAQYYPTNMQYLDEVIANGAPQPLEISFTTRFNAFLPTGSPVSLSKLCVCVCVANMCASASPSPLPPPPPAVQLPLTRQYSVCGPWFRE